MEPSAPLPTATPFYNSLFCHRRSSRQPPLVSQALTDCTQTSSGLGPTTSYCMSTILLATQPTLCKLAVSFFLTNVNNTKDNVGDVGVIINNANNMNKIKNVHIASL